MRRHSHSLDLSEFSIKLSVLPLYPRNRRVPQRHGDRHNVTITAQHCRTCTTTTYVGTVPGYTPGGPCHGCSPYSASTSLDSLPLARPTAATSPSLQVSGYPGYSGIPTRPNSPGLQRTSQESESTIDPGGVGLPATSSSSGGITKLPDDATPTQPPPVASAVPGYPDRPGSPYLPNQPSPPGNPGVPHLLGSTTLPPMASPDSTEPGPTNTPYRPTAVPAPPIVTAGGVRAMPRNVGLGLTGCLLGAAILRM
ncbi:hypothetical protein B0T26DRAFT_352397 [Lasiosphaeria miniovina]|uniref:Uncharacterized protein n=1 Tax=Lasiosphaeria miniovina TaxID=1954250 RepID=A0AA40DV93_9PEZI|nr:uncharacterized protein B0T26DRAFT_352397 [Lasiosphaeria miniovina]KAK0713028.1 hypothetical protein B0T26DRAFT_352397 [Lasiosphaeria miniovina]